MNKRTIPFSKEDLKRIAGEHQTPFHIYDKAAITANAEKMISAFSWVPGGFKNYFAVKALPNPYILKLLKGLGMGADCSSLPELLLAEKVGLKGEEIMFTSNDTPIEEYEYALKLGAVIKPGRHHPSGLPERGCWNARADLLPLQSRSPESGECNYRFS